jgi:hypothetical protein
MSMAERRREGETRTENEEANNKDKWAVKEKMFLGGPLI